jgi:hypothetical protein
MRKWFIGILLFLLIGFLVAVYLIIPSKIIINSTTSAEVTQGGAYRVLGNETKWEKWWRDAAGHPAQKGSPLTYNGYTFRMTGHETDLIGVEISKGNLKLNSIIHLLTVKYDSLLVVWIADTLLPGNNPFSRISAYRRAAEIGDAMKGVLRNFTPYVADPLNVYDCRIYRTSTEDTTMLSARFFRTTYPTTAELYGYFDVVYKSIQKQKGFPKSFPIMDVRKLNRDTLEVQVAIPTNVQLKDDGQVFYRRMEPGNFVATNVMGGTYTTNEALKQLYLFLSDYNGIQMAKPFQILVTDRMKEPDTLKWLTKIYIPVVE